MSHVDQTPGNIVPGTTRVNLQLKGRPVAVPPAKPIAVSIGRRKGQLYDPITGRKLPHVR